MNNLYRCANMMTLGFAAPRDAIYYVNDLMQECIVHDPLVQTTEQFWRGVYARYCAIHYGLNSGSTLRLSVRWAYVEKPLSIECHSRQPYDEPMDSRVFFRLLSGISPDSVRTLMPLDWESLSPALEFGTDEADIKPVEEPTYEELL